MTIVAIDPGTNCGWAVRSTSGLMVAGTWDLTPSRHASAGMRFINFRNLLRQLLEGAPGCRVVYEEVQQQPKSKAAGDVYGGLVAMLQSVCIDAGIEYEGISVGTWKKAMCRNGNAPKSATYAEARRRWPSATIADDNEGDARLIAEYAAQMEPKP